MRNLMGLRELGQGHHGATCRPFSRLLPLLRASSHRKTGTMLMSCSALSKEARRTPRILQRLQVSTEEELGTGSFIYRELRHIVMQVKTCANNVQFSACGFFCLDLTLACSMAQGIACYIIVMVQFESTNKGM